MLDMRRLVEEHADLMRQVIGDFDQFVMLVSNTLRYIETREDAHDRARYDGAQLHYAVEKIRLLIKILVLGQLGFDASRVTSFIERSKDFLNLRASLGKS